MLASLVDEVDDRRRLKAASAVAAPGQVCEAGAGVLGVPGHERGPIGRRAAPCDLSRAALAFTPVLAQGIRYVADGYDREFIKDTMERDHDRCRHARDRRALEEHHHRGGEGRSRRVHRGPGRALHVPRRFRAAIRPHEAGVERLAPSLRPCRTGSRSQGTPPSSARERARAAPPGIFPPGAP